MRIFTKYLFSDLVKPTITALIVLFSIVWLMQSLRFMDYVVNKGVELSTFFWITVLVSPSFLMIIIPLSLFVGATYSYKRLNDENELSALFSAGKSRWGIVWPSMFMAVIVMLTCFSITLWFSPAGMTAFKSLQHNLRQSGGNIMLEEGTFNQMGKNTMIYIREKLPNYQLKGILVHDNKNQVRPMTWMAEEGRIVFNEAGYPSLVLSKGSMQESTADGKRLNVLEFERHTIDIMKQFARQSTRQRGPQELYLGELLNTEGLSAKMKSEYRAEFHKRLLTPLSVFPLILIPALILIRGKSRRFGSVRPATFATALALLYQIVIIINQNLAHEGKLLFLYGQWLLPIAVTIYCCVKLTDQDKEEYEG